MGRKKATKDVPEATRESIALFLAERFCNGRLKRGAAVAAAAKCGQSKARRGRPPSSTISTIVAECLARISATLDRTRQTLRALAHEPKLTLLCYIKEHLVKCVTVRVKSTLSDDHKRRRLAYELAHVKRPIGGRSYQLHHMDDYVHFHDKWFNMYKAKITFYLTVNETAPYTSSPNKRYIGKVMLLAAVARLLYDSHRKCGFNGKLVSGR
ncbi:hypothetical protein F442_22093 [Phytophthora nicotianae P10297]|uniref:Uncharacterized protein n=3 Tax=Phytophthora nicotianae TaxID=4792 RepID=W2Y368_PHYNI|nr:hypothetical protein L916_21485 [Phytophthora nicotianae]ETL77742.1 hypothetical protein L917_21336 [Phytophthora nicotianae]ETP28624.1 hypothetical protein F442_22093 [Phytophthora nicotianae P10297]